MKLRRAKTRDPLIVEVPTVLSRIEKQLDSRERRREERRAEGAGGPRIEAVPFEGVVPLVTLDDPSADPEAARGAFVRLRPPEELPVSEVSSWRDVVAARAVAVRVVPRPRRAGLARPEARRTPADDVRLEATAIAAASDDPEVVALVEKVLSEVERRS